MKTKRVIEFGQIGQDGKILLPMDRIKAFAGANPGARLIARFEVAEPGSTELQRAYYWGYIIPTVQDALLEFGERQSESGVDLMLRSMDAMLYTEEGLLEVEQLTKSQMSDYIDWIKQFAAENLHIFVEDSQTL